MALSESGLGMTSSSSERGDERAWAHASIPGDARQGMEQTAPPAAAMPPVWERLDGDAAQIMVSGPTGALPPWRRPRGAAGAPDKGQREPSPSAAVARPQPGRAGGAPPRSRGPRSASQLATLLLA